jgi:RNA 3'-terminal phosphate cyclase
MGASAPEPFLGVHLNAESDTGVVYTADYLHGEESVLPDIDSEVPEDLGYLAAMQLLDEIAANGCVDSGSQWLVFILMSLAKGASMVRIGRVTQPGIHTLRLISKMLRVRFEIEELEETGQALFKCNGIGYENFARRVE